MNSLLLAAVNFVSMVDPTPSADDTKAGWGAFALFLAMAVAVALLGWSLTRHLKKTKLNAEAGAFGEVEKPAESESSTQT